MVETRSTRVVQTSTTSSFAMHHRNDWLVRTMKSLLTPPPSSSPIQPERKPSEIIAAQKGARKRRLDNLDSSKDPKPKRRQHVTSHSPVLMGSAPGSGDGHHVPVVQAAVQPQHSTSAGTAPPPRKKRAKPKRASKSQQAAKTLARAAITASADQSASPYHVTTWQPSTIPHPPTKQPGHVVPAAMPPLRPSQYADQWPSYAWHDGFAAPQQMPWMAPVPASTSAMSSFQPLQAHVSEPWNVPGQALLAHQTSAPTGYQEYMYDVPNRDTTSFVYSTQIARISIPGSASHPIVLNDSTSASKIGPTNPAVKTDSQPSYLPTPVSAHTSTFDEDKENSTTQKAVGCPPPASQPVTVQQPATGPITMQAIL